MAAEPNLSETDAQRFLASLVPPSDHADRVDKGQHRIAEQMECFADRRPSILYHYTSAAAAASIIQGGSMRATNLFHMNDASELAYGMEVVVRALEQRASSVAGPAQQVCAAWRGMLPAMAVAAAPFAVGVYASCYAESPDDMGQWRAYADGGRGVALAFDMKGVEAAHGTAMLGRVVYDAETQAALVQRLLDRELQALADDIRTCQPGARGEPSGLWPILRAQMLGIIPLLELVSRFKHPSFSHEREWRLREFHRARGGPTGESLAPFYIDGYVHPRVGFGSRGGQLVPYVEHLRTPDGLPLAAAIVGPCCDQQLQAAALRLALDTSRLQRAGLSRSELPMR